jgi:hypothetical protein
MPMYDGTGPRGLGPMTGQGGGYCLLKLPSSPGEPLSGFTGQSGFPVRLRPDGIGMDLASLRLWVQRLEAELHDIRRRIVALGRK